MRLEELETFLTTATAGERYHLEHAGDLSPRYKNIERVTVDGVEMFNFSFYQAMGDHDIWLMKESRYTPIPLHVHEVVELAYIYQGHCSQCINGQTVRLSAGDFCLLGPNTPHEISPLGDADIVITIDMRERYLVENLMRRLSSRELVTRFLASVMQRSVHDRRYLIFNTGDDEIIRQLMQQLMCAYYSDDVHQEVLNAYLTIVFSRLMRIGGVTEQGDPSVDDRIVDVLQYIDRHLDANLEAVAHQFGYNASYLGSLIKKKTGRSFRDIVQRQRMSTAAFSLAATNLPVYEIAESVGYKNLSFFYRTFERTYGMTPHAYRKERQAEEKHETS